MGFVLNSLLNYKTVKVTVVNVEKEINICLNETHSKLLFVDHAFGEISVNSKKNLV